MNDPWFPNLQSLGPRILFSRNSAGDDEATRLSLAVVHLHQEGTDVTLMHPSGQQKPTGLMETQGIKVRWAKQ